MWKRNLRAISLFFCDLREIISGDIWYEEKGILQGRQLERIERRTRKNGDLSFYREGDPAFLVVELYGDIWYTVYVMGNDKVNIL